MPTQKQKAFARKALKAYKKKHPKGPITVELLLKFFKQYVKLAAALRNRRRRKLGGPVTNKSAATNKTFTQVVDSRYNSALNGQHPEGKGGPIDAFLKRSEDQLVVWKPPAREGAKPKARKWDGKPVAPGEEVTITRKDGTIEDITEDLEAFEFVAKKAVKDATMKAAKASEEVTKANKKIAEKERKESADHKVRSASEFKEKLKKARKEITELGNDWSLQRMNSVLSGYDLPPNKKRTADEAWDLLVKNKVEKYVKKDDELRAKIRGTEAIPASPAKESKHTSKETAAPKVTVEEPDDMEGEGGGPLSTSQINQLMEKIPEFIGAFPCDAKIDPGKRKVAAWIWNLDRSDQPGSHWVAVLITRNSAEYFNSFGNPPTPDMRKEIERVADIMHPDTNKTLKINKITHQSASTATCGYHAMKFIRDRLSGESFPKVTGYDDRHRSVAKYEKSVDEFEKKYPKFVQIGRGLFSLEDKAPHSVEQTIKNIGKWPIKSITVMREPINGAISGAMNLLSLGKWNEALKQAGGYDKMFHLFVVVRVADEGGREQLYRVEKNATVSTAKIGSIPTGKTIESIAAPAKGTFGDLFKNTPKGFWMYDAFSNNCQVFISKILGNIGAYTATVRAFVMQNGVEVGKKLGWFARTAAKFVTDLGGRVDGAIDKTKHAARKIVDWFRGRKQQSGKGYWTVSEVRPRSGKWL